MGSRKRSRKRKINHRDKERKKARKKQRKLEAVENEGSDDDVVDFSVSRAREELGLNNTDTSVEVERRKGSSEYMKFKKKERKPIKKLKDKLRPELTCCLCLGILTQPVTSSCGHSFCRVCLAEALFRTTKDFGYFFCPQCRKRLPIKGIRRFAVNKSLVCVLETLFKSARKTENEHIEFEKALENLRNEKPEIVRPTVIRTEHFEIMCGVSCVRTIVSDPNDPYMRFAIGVSKDFERCFFNQRDSFSSVILYMEEDEDDQVSPMGNERTGFPLILQQDSLFQKKDFESPVCLQYKYGEENENFESSSTAVQGVAEFKNFALNETDAEKLLIKILIPHIPELYISFEVDIKLVDHVYYSSVFANVNQDPSSRILILEGSDGSRCSNDYDPLGDEDTDNSFIVDTDDESRLFEVDSQL